LLGNGSIGTLNFTTGSQILGNFILNRQASTIGFDLGTDLSINGTLSLTNGIANLTNKTLIITLAGTITGASSSNYIIADFTNGGVLRKNLNTASSFTFPIGDSALSSDGSQYSPATINFTSATFSSGWIGMAVEDAIELNCIGATDYISRYWNLTSSGITNATYDFTGTYLPVDIVGTETKCISTRFSTSNSSWTDGANLVLGSNTISLVGLTSASGALTSPNHFTAAYRLQEIRVERSTNALIPTGSPASNGYDTIFVGQPLFSTSVTKTYIIRNIGNADLIISNPILIGANPGDFIISSATSLTLSGSTTVTFTIAFKPTALGTRTATVKIVNNDSDENPYLFDVEGNGECPAVTNSITPTSGPIGTEITVVSSDSVLNDLSISSAMFNSEPAVVTPISSTEIKVEVPFNALSGYLNVTNSLGCVVSNSFTVIDNTIASCQGNGTPRINLFISEVSDHGSGSHSYIEIFNATGSAVNLLNYTVRIHNNGATTATSTITLPSFILANNTAYVIAFGSTDAGSNPGGITPNLINSAAGINDNDNIRLYDSSGIWIDLWGNTLNTSFTIALKNYSYRRKNSGITAPSTSWNPNDWEAFSPVDYSDIGLYDFSIGSPPIVTLHPSYTPTCKATSLMISGEEGYNGNSPADTKELAYQWYVNVPPAIGWTALSNDLIYSGVNEDELSISDISGLIYNQYYCQIREDSSDCYAATNAVKITDGGVAIWNGAWINGPPTLNKLVIIDADYSTSTEGSFDACSLIVNASKTLTISSDNYTNIKNDLTVNGNLIVENNGSVVQIEDSGINTGNISVNRIAKAKNLDYVYWSSPVSDFAVKSLPNTHHYEWNTTIVNPKGSQGNWVKPSTTNMTKGKGYISRASNGATTPQDLPVTFVGVPFNGKFNFSISRGSNTSSINDNWNLIGNPYPSAIDAIDFLYENADPSGPNPVLEGAIHIWTHDTPPAKIASPFYDNFYSNYSNTDFIVYNAMGTVSGPNTFLGKIATGQGFLVTMIDGIADNTKSIIFKNSMRDKAYKNDNFYKTKSPNKTNIFETEKHRIWLDLIKQDGGSHRTLIGYSQGATLDKDVMFDASFEVSGMNIYSLIENKAMIIQGRPIPFNKDDRVSLGINILTEGDYFIAIGDADGLFLDSSQNIFLEDTKVNIVHDLKLSPYSFYSEKGNYQNRFILRYTDSSLKTKNYLDIENSVKVVTNKNKITIFSSVENIQNITIYDIVGRKIVEMKNENSSEIIINNIHVKNQSLILKIELQNGEIISKKTVL
ncbi:MAG TPA: choice-of-anchor D domain-containing protein, partial [Flavobacterium sp.]|nr:choice-of-anchor D domain-containing protein [Flavobacterium sp.]